MWAPLPEDQELLRRSQPDSQGAGALEGTDTEPSHLESEVDQVIAWLPYVVPFSDPCRLLRDASELGHGTDVLVLQSSQAG